MLVNGQSFAGTSHLLDGTDNHDAVLGWIVINPTLESVTEAKITTANYDAEFGVASAGVVSAQTKSGTNAIHGSAFEFLRKRSSAGPQPVHAVDARFRIPAAALIPLTQWNQFGAIHRRPDPARTSCSISAIFKAPAATPAAERCFAFRRRRSARAT